MSTEIAIRERMNIVIVGHVDHGKSTLLGRLYADTGTLPVGKIEKIQAICRQQGKEFEYAFLFDAFLEEQQQGITIDTARTFFSWGGRQYIIIDAPGHKEFLKNMVSGAARAEAALLVIDALEGVRDQSKRHGLLLSMLGSETSHRGSQQDGPRQLPGRHFSSDRERISRISHPIERDSPIRHPCERQTRHQHHQTQP